MGLRKFLGLTPRENLDEINHLLEKVDDRAKQDALDQLEVKARLEALGIQVDNMSRRGAA